MNINNYTYYYFIGIGGIGMSALARFFRHNGKKVFGYDKTQTVLTERLQKEGMEIHFEEKINRPIPQDATQENTLVIYTPAVPASHKELGWFKAQDYTLIKRAKALGELTKYSTCFAVAGTHGKTTTSTLLGHLMHAAEKPSTAFLGGIAENYGQNLILGGNEMTVVEADEYDRSFLNLYPDYAAITSMDLDHLDIYTEENSLENSFLAFAQQVKKQLFVKKGLPIPNALTYAVEDTEADYYAFNLQIENHQPVFSIRTPRGIIKNLSFPLPGKHNIENATAAIALALEAGLTEKEIRTGLASFKGVKRRFTRESFPNGKVIIDDYAHHPEELKAIIASVKRLYPAKNILGVFQPHLYSRTKDFMNEFAESLNELENLILLDIYPAREEAIPGITSEKLAEKLKNKPKVLPLNQAVENIQKSAFDVLLLMGAGNIDTLYEPLKTWMSHEA